MENGTTSNHSNILSDKMQYRYLGPTGIKVSVIGYGNWINSDSEDSQKLTNDCVKAAWDVGINFFDTA